MLKRVVCGILLFCLLNSAFATVIVYSGHAQASDAPFFSDDFNGSAVDQSKWTVQYNTNMSGSPAWGGNVTVSNGGIALSSDGSSFPCVTSAADPFSATGDFSLQFNFTYTSFGADGNGLWISNGPLSWLQGEDSGVSILQYWAGNGGGVTNIIAYLMGNLVYRYVIPAPASKDGSFQSNPNSGPGPTQTIRLDYIDGTYTLTIDGTQIATAQSDLRPDNIGFGHPQAYYVPFPYVGVWSSFQIDYIEVLPTTQMTISTSASTTQLGYAVNIAGTVATEGGEPVVGANVILSYMIPGLQTWTPITSAVTDSNGSFSAQWLPQATGTFAVNAEWSGNNVCAGSWASQNISVLEGAGEPMFFVESNSTLSALTFNSTANELSFTVSGESGTTGYTQVVLSKALISNITGLTLFIDGQPVNYSSTSLNESWILYFQYHHSSHEVTLKIQNQVSPTFQPQTATLKQPTASQTVNPNKPLPLGNIYLVAVILAFIALAGATLIAQKRKHQTKNLAKA